MFVSGECRWCNGGVSCERAQCNRVPLAAPTPAAREWVSWSSREATLQNWQQPLHARLTRKLETRSSSQVIFSSGGTRSQLPNKFRPPTHEGGGECVLIPAPFLFCSAPRFLTFRCVLFGSFNARQTVCKFNSALARNEAARAKAQLVPRPSVSFSTTIRSAFFAVRGWCFQERKKWGVNASF